MTVRQGGAGSNSEKEVRNGKQRDGGIEIGIDGVI